jgi:hypothetical protein
MLPGHDASLRTVLRGNVDLPLEGVHFFPMRTNTCFFMCLTSVRARRTCVCPHGEEMHALKWKIYASTQDITLGGICFHSSWNREKGYIVCNVNTWYRRETKGIYSNIYCDFTKCIYNLKNNEILRWKQ